MSPTSAGQYRWAAEFAPRKHYRIISWIQAWVTLWGPQLTTAALAYLSATTVQALIVLNYSTYVPQPWYACCIYWLITLLGAVINIRFAKSLPYIEGFLFIWHIAVFFAGLIPLVHLGPQTSTTFVFTSTADFGGWNNYGLTFCVGLVTSTFPFVRTYLSPKSSLDYTEWTSRL